MSKSRQKLLTAGGALVAAMVLWGAVQVVYYKPRANALNARLAEATEKVRGYQDALDTRPRLQRQLREVIDSTLGGDVEAVDHRLRTRLNRIAEDLQLHQPSVSTGRPSARPSPARLLFPTAARELRDELDFVELDGSISAEGTLEQVVALVDRIQAEPWMKRFNSVRLDPKNNGERFGVTVRLTTLFLPGQTPEGVPAGAYDADRMARFASLVQANPFRMPPPVVAAPAQPQQPTATPQPRMEQWLVTGIAQGPDGVEAWLRNARSGESRRIGVGQRVREAVLVAANGDEAEFEVDQRRLVVAIGSTLSVQVR